MLRKILQLHVLVLCLLGMAACNNNEQGLSDKNGSNNLDDSISSMSTGTPSSEYPQTEPILIHGAKYEFRIVDGRQEGYQAFDGGKVPAVTPKYPQATAQREQQQEQQLRQMRQAQQQRQAQQTQQTPQQQTPQAAPASGISAEETKVIQLTNAERRRNGLPDLQADTSLSKVAREKANDMQAKHYFSHTSPTYGSPFDMMRDFGISYRSAGENIAQGQPTPEEVVQAWMNSEGHRRNILSGDFTHIGVGYNQQGNYWTQMFIKK